MSGIQVFWTTGLLIPSILFLFVSFAIAGAIFQKKQKRAFDLRSDFPFEYMDAGESNLRISRVALIAWGLFDAAVAFYLLATIDRHSALLSLGIIYAVSGLLRNIALVATFYVPAYRFKPHFFAFVSSGALTGFSSAVATIICANVRQQAGWPAIAFAIGIAVLGVASMIVLVNPKLANWAKLDSSVDESGAVVEKRPKIFILAFSEWLVFTFAAVLSIVCFLGFVTFDLL